MIKFVSCELIKKLIILDNMKKILLFTSILFLTITDSLFAQTTPSIANVFVSDSIDCYGGLGDITIEIIQTTLPTAPLELLIGYYPTWSTTFLFKKTSASVTTISTIVIPNLDYEDYIVRLIDPVLYYAANPNGNGSSLAGVYDEYSINLTQPDQLIASTFVVASNLCAVDCIAAEDLLIDGGTGPYSFTVNGGASQNLASGDSIYNFIALCAGNYDVLVTDTNGCSTTPSTTTFTIAPIVPIIPAGFVSSIYSGVNVSCNGFTNGEITAAATGSVGSLEYSIDSALTFQSSTIFSNLAAGPYTITYRDDNCSTTQALIISEPPLLSGVLNISQNVDCYNASTGKITFTVDLTNTGVGVYEYSINASPYQSGSAVQDFSTLPGDSLYEIIVKDNNGCMDTSSVYLVEPLELSFLANVTQEVSCFNYNDAEIIINTPLGGTPPYDFSSDGGVSYVFVHIFDSLIAGQYTITVRDSALCTKDTIIDINNPFPFEISSDINHPICFGDCNGEISITSQFIQRNKCS